MSTCCVDTVTEIVNWCFPEMDDDSDLNWLAELRIASSLPINVVEQTNTNHGGVSQQPSFQGSSMPSSRPPIVRMPSGLLSEMAEKMMQSPTDASPFLSLANAPNTFDTAGCAGRSTEICKDLGSLAAALRDDAEIPEELRNESGLSRTMDSSSFLRPRSKFYRSSDGFLADPGHTVPNAYNRIPRRASESAASAHMSPMLHQSVGHSIRGSLSASPICEVSGSQTGESSTSEANGYLASKSTSLDSGAYADISSCSATSTVSPKKSPSAKTPRKRRSVPLGGICQFKECRADISNASMYNRRYHMCKDCMRARSVMVDSQEMRWCQQCTCLHPLSAFIGDRRSCKEKMDIHSDRRRLRSKIKREMNKIKAAAAAAGQTKS